MCHWQEKEENYYLIHFDAGIPAVLARHPNWFGKGQMCGPFTASEFTPILEGLREHCLHFRYKKYAREVTIFEYREKYEEKRYNS